MIKRRYWTLLMTETLPGVAGTARFSVPPFTTSSYSPLTPRNRESICADSYSAALTSIFSTPYAPKLAYMLSANPIEDSISVSLQETECDNGWIYDSASNSVVLLEGGPCSPGPDQTIKVTYSTPCVQE